MFGHVQKGPIDAILRNIDSLDVTGTSRKRERPKKIWIETVKNNRLYK